MPLPYHEVLLAVVVALVGASAIGMGLHGKLSERQRSRETVEQVRLVISILVTFTAVVLGLLLSEAKSSYDGFDNRLRALAGAITELDQRLRQYGDETAPIRANLRAYLAGAIADTWRDEPRPAGVYPTYSDTVGVERAPLGNLLIEVDTAIRKLDPADPFHAGLANLLETKTTELVQERRLAIEFGARNDLLAAAGGDDRVARDRIRGVRADRAAERRRLCDDHPLRPRLRLRPLLHPRLRQAALGHDPGVERTGA